MKYVLALLIVGLLGLGFVEALLPFDDTDPAPTRSGLTRFTDNLTGCEYVGRSTGGITPRLDQSGKQICRTQR